MRQGTRQNPSTVTGLVPPPKHRAAGGHTRHSVVVAVVVVVVVVPAVATSTSTSTFPPPSALSSSSWGTSTELKYPGWHMQSPIDRRPVCPPVELRGGHAVHWSVAPAAFP